MPTVNFEGKQGIVIERQVELAQEIVIKAKATTLIKKMRDLDANKIIIKDYEEENKSEYLVQLEAKRKKLNEELKEEKERIQEELMEDREYKDAALAVTNGKIDTRRIKGELRELLLEYESGDQLVMFRFDVEGEPVTLQAQKTVDLYIDGKEEK